METPVASSPYLKATSRDSHAIRAMLDRQEAEYVEWRSNRKPIRHPFASSKLNSPLKCTPQERQQASAKPLWLALLEPSQRRDDEDNQRTSLASSSSRQDSFGPSRRMSRASLPSSRPGTRGRTQSVSTPTLPSLQKSQDQLSTSASLASIQTRNEWASSPQIPPHRKKPSGAKRRLQKNLYDFHSSIVFSVAPEDTEPLLPALSARDESKSRPSPREPDVVVIELPPPEQDDERDPFVLSGLGVVNETFFSALFEFDWAHSDLERIVRDAVERKRIKAILAHWYRVLVLYFRQFAGKTALASTPVSSHYFAADLLQIPNRLSLLEALNVQCVDPAKFGLTETPLRRDGLISFVTLAAKMVAVHSAQPAQFRAFTAEGIEVSEAVRTLMVDHLAVYAQVQDASHFRNVFLLDHHDRQGRRLRHILTKHEGSLSSFFFEAITSATAATASRSAVRVRTDSYRLDRLQTPAATTMSFYAFVSVLKTLQVIPSGAETRRARPTQDKVPVATLDENRAMRIFQQCLDLNAELSTAHRPQSSGVGAAIVARQQLTYPQFVEALLRVTLLCHETAICRGGFDICPGQQTSDMCRCREAPPAYNLSAFDDAIEALFTQVQTLRLRRASKRTSLKMLSLHSLSGRQQSAGSVARLHQRHPALVVEPEASDSPRPEEEAGES